MECQGWFRNRDGGDKQFPAVLGGEGEMGTPPSPCPKLRSFKELGGMCGVKEGEDTVAQSRGCS